MQFVLTINMPTVPDRPGIPIAQILREVTPVVELQIPVRASHTYNDRLYGTTKATWTWS
jgi:hypothetical protein